MSIFYFLVKKAFFWYSGTMFGLFNKKVTLVTHSGKFHTDDIFACAILMLVLEKEGKKVKIIRTRDSEIIAKGDYVFDVGGEHDPARRRFDHHQKGGAGSRDNSIPYAACGLVWKEFGLSLSGSQTAADRIDKKLIQPIDANDNGVSLVDVKGDIRPYLIQDAFSSFVAIPEEDDTTNDRHFEMLVGFAKKILSREIMSSQYVVKFSGVVQSLYENASDKRIIIFEENIPAEDVLMKYPEPLYMIRPNTDGNWRVTGVHAKEFSFEVRYPFPKAWAGLRDGELAEISGIADAVFCHNGRFLAVAKSKEGAIKLAQLAVENKE